MEEDDVLKRFVARIWELIGEDELTEEEIEDIIFDYRHGDWFA